MSPADRQDLRQRCQRAVAAPVPSAVREGTGERAAQYKADAAVCLTFARTGGAMGRARFAVCRLEGVQGRA